MKKGFLSFSSVLLRVPFQRASNFHVFKLISWVRWLPVFWTDVKKETRKAFQRLFGEFLFTLVTPTTLKSPPSPSPELDCALFYVTRKVVPNQSRWYLDTRKFCIIFCLSLHNHQFYAPSCQRCRNANTSTLANNEGIKYHMTHSRTRQLCSLMTRSQCRPLPPPIPLKAEDPAWGSDDQKPWSSFPHPTLPLSFAETVIAGQNKG